MLILWIRYAWRAVLRFLIPPPVEPKGPISVNAPCPGCGHERGSIKFARLDIGSGKTKEPKVVHTCEVCGCQWGDDPIYAARCPVI